MSFYSPSSGWSLNRSCTDIPSFQGNQLLDWFAFEVSLQWHCQPIEHDKLKHKPPLLQRFYGNSWGMIFLFFYFYKWWKGMLAWTENILKPTVQWLPFKNCESRLSWHMCPVSLHTFCSVDRNWDLARPKICCECLIIYHIPPNTCIIHNIL